ncbi:MAG: hypothetical protein HOE90_02840 [Bacteriovoracaceae bacterium]|nr:hypothetical protein [Bacteriovoracaceae bacterium]
MRKGRKPYVEITVLLMIISIAIINIYQDRKKENYTLKLKKSLLLKKKRKAVPWIDLKGKNNSKKIIEKKQK